MPLNIDVNQKQTRALKIALEGSLDSETAPDLEKIVSEIGEEVQLVIFDMKDLTFLSSAGLRVIFSTLKRQKAKGGRVAVSHMSPGVKKVFEIVKALPDLTVFASVEEMDAYLASFQ
ncbi:STAS domain-containing protein [Pseudomaricurvus sp.]|uniref:STAS domain-containing protein n=1 Tax=Pseudomaricurvus sp. TaxID=2004510 RepID=UPI003F6BB8B4